MEAKLVTYSGEEADVKQRADFIFNNYSNYMKKKYQYPVTFYSDYWKCWIVIYHESKWFVHIA